MAGRLRSVGLIGTGVIAGVLVSLGISAYAFRDNRGQIPLEEIRQFEAPARCPVSGKWQATK